VSDEVEIWLNPHTSFIAFLNTLCFDHTVLLDLLVSNETCFLLYLLRYLKVCIRYLLICFYSYYVIIPAVSYLYRMLLVTVLLLTLNILIVIDFRSL